MRTWCEQSVSTSDNALVNTGSIQTPEPRGSATREKNVPQIPEFLTLVQERGLYGVHINPDQSAMTNITNLSPDQAGQQQKPAQPLQETETKGQEMITFRRDVLQTASRN